MRKLLFIDRDGTLIKEPPDNFRIDSFEKLSFLPGVFKYLGKIVSELNYQLVMVTNQDGLGSIDFPEEKFYPVHNFLISSLKNEGINFLEECIDRSFEYENKTSRKPNVGMLKKYFSGEYNLTNSFVIGDSITDIKLAKNLGAKAIFIKNYDKINGYENEIVLACESWEEIYNFLKLES